jgi:hypothetical protein
MGTLGLQIKRIFLYWFVELVVPVQEIFILPWLLLRSDQYKIFFPHRPATGAGSRAGPPVSEGVSPLVLLLLS